MLCGYIAANYTCSEYNCLIVFVVSFHFTKALGPFVKECMPIPKREGK